MAATLKMMVENGGCTVKGQIPTIFRLVSSVETKNQIQFKEAELKGLLKEERYHNKKIGTTHEKNPIKMLADIEERWEIEYELIKNGKDSICCIRRVFHKGEVLYQVPTICVGKPINLEFS